MAAAKSTIAPTGRSNLQNAPAKPEEQGFFARVYSLVARIPPGKVMTYGQIARELDNICSARYVGYAIHSAPEDLNLPCHRVINRLGEMAPGNIFGGAQEQARRLKAEGVVFRKNGRVDLTASLFLP